MRPLWIGWFALACAGDREPVATPIPGPDGTCDVPEGWPDLVAACADEALPQLPRGCQATLAPVNPLTGVPYTDAERARVTDLREVSSGARLVPGTEAAALRECVEMPRYRDALSALRAGGTDIDDRLAYHCVLVRDLAARTALAESVVADPNTVSEAREKYGRIADCLNVTDQRRRIVTLWSQSAPRSER